MTIPMPFQTRAGFIFALSVGMAAAIASAPIAFAESIQLFGVKDNTLIQSNTGSRSNGSGPAIFCGRIGVDGGGTFRRALVAFDLSSIPAGSTITNVTLTLSLNGSNSPPQTHTLHRVLADWGEGASSSDTGQGAPSQPNDATWLHRFYPSVFWSAPGGDYIAQPSATTIIGEDLIPYSVSSQGMVDDVQYWLDHPAANFGWMMKGNEAVLQTAKKFASCNVADPFSKPRLDVVYTLPTVPCDTDVTGDNVTSVADLLAVINSWGACEGACPPSCYCDIVQDCTVGVPDLLAIIEHWGECGSTTP